jgi:hypothetical protein
MGGALEAGKLVAASYLYRYWNVTNNLLKGYMMAGIIALMVLTSGGIFGYLSSGYQTDVLPLKELNAQVKILEEEKTRILTRKTQIDEQIAKLPTPNLGKIDFTDPKATDAATRALAQTQRLRDTAMRSFQAEQQQVTKRANELEKEILGLRQKQIKTEAHVGPIIYIANAFEVETDQATKWLVLLIIFAFDPMAVALTLAVNIALRRRQEELDAGKTPSQPLAQIEPQVRFVEKIVEKPVEVIKEVPVEKVVERIVEKPVEVIKEVPVEKIVYVDRPAPEPVSVPEPTQQPEEVKLPKDVRTPNANRQRSTYSALWTEGTGTQEKIEKLLDHYKLLRDKQRSGANLSKEEQWELTTISDILKKKGFDAYLS